MCPLGCEAVLGEEGRKGQSVSSGIKGLGRFTFTETCVHHSLAYAMGVLCTDWLFRMAVASGPAGRILAVPVFGIIVDSPSLAAFRSLLASTQIHVRSLP